MAGTRRWRGQNRDRTGGARVGGSDRHLRRLWSCSSSSVNECCSSNWPVAEKAVTVPCGRWKVNWYVASKREKISANNDAVAWGGRMRHVHRHRNSSAPPTRCNSHPKQEAWPPQQIHLCSRNSRPLTTGGGGGPLGLGHHPLPQLTVGRRSPSKGGGGTGGVPGGAGQWGGGGVTCLQPVGPSKSPLLCGPQPKSLTQTEP